MTWNRSACLKTGCTLAAAVFLMAQGPMVNSPADMNQSNNPNNQAVTQNVLPPPDTPTYTGPDIDKTKKQPPASDQTSGTMGGNNPADQAEAQRAAAAGNQ
jgi:hypothetical protein